MAKKSCNHKNFVIRPFPSYLLSLCHNDSSFENIKNENEFLLHVHFHANQSHLSGFARGVVLKLKQKATRKWPISHVDGRFLVFCNECNLHGESTVRAE